MKKLVVIALLVSAATVAAFLSANKACLFMRSCLIGSSAEVGAYGGLGLRPDQKRAIESLEKAFRPEAQALCREICAERAKLLDSVASASVSEPAIVAQTEKIGGLQTRLEQAVIRHMLVVGKILDPSQKSRYLARIRAGIKCPFLAAASFGK